MIDFEKKFLNFIEEHDLFTKSHKLIVGVSGGCDSVVLIRLLKAFGFQANAVHCNFQLRGENSNEDERFVKKLTKELHIKLYSEKFNTLNFAEINKYSVEEAARILRYTYFEKIRKENAYDFILTAHHLTDKIETFFINLIAGTGIKGLRSIQAANGKLVRPLLFAGRDEIEGYAKENNTAFRTDESNFDTRIIRNRIRHNIIPEIEKINPSFLKTMQNNFSLLADFEEIYDEYTKNAEEKIKSKNENVFFLNISELNKISGKTSVLYEILHPYGFNSSQIRSLAEKFDKLQTGKLLLSNTHKIIKDRDNLIVDSINAAADEEILINKGVHKITKPIRLSFQIIPIDKDFEIIKKKNHAYLDADTVNFPLSLRKRKAGDRFIPFGMKGSKLISDFITDLKLSYAEKENVYVLTNDTDILWVIGYRIDDRFKVTEKTQHVLTVKLDQL